MSEMLTQLDSCLNDVIKWMTTYNLKMNESKTEIIIYGTKQQLVKLSIDHVKVGSVEVKSVNQVRPWCNYDKYP